jgi:hypothetical protein
MENLVLVVRPGLAEQGVMGSRVTIEELTIGRLRYATNPDLYLGS